MCDFIYHLLTVTQFFFCSQTRKKICLCQSTHIIIIYFIMTLDSVLNSSLLFFCMHMQLEYMYCILCSVHAQFACKMCTMFLYFLLHFCVCVKTFTIKSFEGKKTTTKNQKNWTDEEECTKNNEENPNWIPLNRN